MSYAVMPLSNYVDACDTIREKTNNTELIKSGELADKVNEVYKAGEDAEWNAFWDKYQKNGTRTNYIYGFAGYGFGNENFYPKYDIKPTGDMSKMFYDWVNHNTNALNLKERLEECRVVLDISGANRIAAAFSWTKFTEIPALDVRGASSSALGYQENLFNSSKVLKKIGTITVNENNLFKGWFSNCFELVDVSFLGTIGQSDFDVSTSTKLSHASLMSIINALKDFEAEAQTSGSYTTTDGVNDVTLPKSIVRGSVTISDVVVIDEVMYYVSNVKDNGEGEFIDATHGKLGTIDYATGVISISKTYIPYGAEITYKYTNVVKTIKFGTANLAKLTDAEIAMATEKGWSVG